MTSPYVRLFETAEGYLGLIRKTHMGHFCGYVGVPKSHPAAGFGEYDDNPNLPLTDYGQAINDVIQDVHGGITYSDGVYPLVRAGEVEEEPEKGLWWIGWDYATTAGLFQMLAGVTDTYTTTVAEVEDDVRNVSRQLKALEKHSSVPVSRSNPA